MGKAQSFKKNNGKNYDAIVGADILHHVDIRREIKDFKKYLGKNGIIVFSEPNAINPLWYLHYFLKKIPWQIEKGILACTSWNFKKILKELGFNHKIVGHGLIPTRFVKNNRFAHINAFILGNLPIINILCFRFIVAGYLTKLS